MDDLSGKIMVLSGDLHLFFRKHPMGWFFISDGILLAGFGFDPYVALFKSCGHIGEVVEFQPDGESGHN